jgi:phosphoglycolate phosphatase
MIRAVLFDKDDTLIDLGAFWRKPVGETAALITERCGRGGDTVLREKLEKAAGFSDGHLIAESPVVAGTNRDVICACDRVMRGEGIVVNGREKMLWEKALAGYCLSDGTVVGKENFRFYFEKWRSMGIRLGVVTSDSLEPTRKCLEELQIMPCLDAVYTADCGLPPKPAPQTAWAFCRLCGTAPSETAMVGDSENDMLYAARSGLLGYLYRRKPVFPLPAGTVKCIAGIEELAEAFPCNSRGTC